MVNSPIVVLIELVIGVIKLAIEQFRFIFSKLLEFFYSVSVVTGNVILSLIIAGLMGGLILFLLKRQLFGSARTIIIFGLIFLLLIFIIALILSFYPALLVSG